MKTLEELWDKFSKLHDEADEIYKLIKNHPDRPKTFFTKLKIKETNQYLNYLVDRTNYVDEGSHEFTYIYNGFVCKAEYQVIEGVFTGISFYYDGKFDGYDDFDLYEYSSYGKHIPTTKWLKIYLSKKLDVDVLNRILEKEKSEEFVKAGFLLFLNKFIKR